MLQKIKDWLLMILLALVGLLTAILFARKPDWVKEKEKEVECRQEKIKKEKKVQKQAESEYKEMIAKHDKEIAETGQNIKKPDIDNPDAAANYIDDILSALKSRESSIRESKKG